MLITNENAYTICTYRFVSNISILLAKYMQWVKHKNELKKIKNKLYADGVEPDNFSINPSAKSSQQAPKLIELPRHFIRNTAGARSIFWNFI